MPSLATLLWSKGYFLTLQSKGIHYKCEWLVLQIKVSEMSQITDWTILQHRDQETLNKDRHIKITVNHHTLSFWTSLFYTRKNTQTSGNTCWCSHPQYEKQHTMKNTTTESPPAIKVSNGAKIRNRYNQVPHLTQDTNKSASHQSIIIHLSLILRYVGDIVVVTFTL